MAAFVVVDSRPYRGKAFLYVNKEEARALMDLIASADEFPGRVRHFPLSPASPQNHPIHRSRLALRIVSSPDSPMSVGLDELTQPEPRIVVRTGDRTVFHEGLQRVIDGGWDFSISLGFLEPVDHPKMAEIRLTFL